jgi:uncharacterized protein (DUF1778 family)
MSNAQMKGVEVMDVRTLRVAIRVSKTEFGLFHRGAKLCGRSVSRFVAEAAGAQARNEIEEDRRRKRLLAAARKADLEDVGALVEPEKGGKA